MNAEEFSEKVPLVSVVIPTLNSERTMFLCLQSIEKQTYPKVETIVVDGNSQDRTIEIAGKFGVRLIRLSSERCTARNYGAKKAKGAFLLFIDSDMELTSTVIEECMTSYIKGKKDAIIIPEENVGAGFIAKCLQLEKEMRVGGKHSEAPRFFVREAFQEVGGYDENLVLGEDFDLSARITIVGFKVGRIGSRIRHHEGHVSMKKITRKAYYYGKTFSNYAQKNPILAIKTSIPTHILKGKRRFNTHVMQPAHFFGLLFIKAIQYGAYLVGMFNSSVG